MSLVNSLNKFFAPPSTSINQISNPTVNFQSYSSENPFVSQHSKNSYGKNSPLPGGIFAGYYNNQPNYVAKKLFILV